MKFGLVMKGRCLFFPVIAGICMDWLAAKAVQTPTLSFPLIKKLSKQKAMLQRQTETQCIPPLCDMLVFFICIYTDNLKTP